MLQTGAVAPDFELVNQDRQPVRLSSFRGRAHVVLAFHPLAFTPNCSLQMQSYERERARFEALGATIFGISTDPGPSKKAWSVALGGLSHDLLSDFYPQGEVSRQYGALRPDGLSERAVVIVDKAGIVRWTKQYDMDEAPAVEDVLTALQAIAT